MHMARATTICPLPFIIGFIYRNGKCTESWCDDFTQMMTKVNSLKCKTIILGDFNKNLLVSQPEWESMVDMLGLNQIITEPTRIQK